MFIVKLEQGVWIASGNGDPPRSVVEANAKRYLKRSSAENALSEARQFFPFLDAKIYNKPLDIER